MKRVLIFLLVLLAVLAATLAFLRLGRSPLSNTPAAAATPPPQAVVVGPGRVEPASEELRVGVEIEGRLREVTVDEGSHVRKGDVLAVIENGDYRARVTLAQAEVASREAELQRVMAGARAEERREAAAAVKEAEATLAHDRAEQSR